MKRPNSKVHRVDVETADRNLTKLQRKVRNGGKVDVTDNGRIVGSVDGFGLCLPFQIHPSFKRSTQAIRADDGSVDIQKVMRLFGFNAEDLAKAIRVSPNALRKKASSKEIQDQLENFAAITLMRLLKQASSEEAFRNWLNRKMPSLDGESPRQVILKRGCGQIADHVLNLIAGNPS